jgi:putative membrane protein
MTHSLIAAGGREFGRLHDRGFHPILGLLCLVALGAAIGLGVWLIIRRRPAPAHAPTGGPAAAGVSSPTAAAETVLADRLARGEIDPDEYRARLDALRGSTLSPAAGPAPTTD